MTYNRFRAFVTTVFDAFGLSRRAAPTARLPVAAPPPAPVKVDLAGQVVRCTVRFDADAKVCATLSGIRAPTEAFSFVPAALVAQKTKSVADGVVATLESLSTAGTSACLGFDAFLERLAERMPADGPGRARLDAALDLARSAAVPSGAARVFLDTPLASKPLGVYTWGDDLRRVFQRDRYLQAPLPPAEADALWQAIRTDEAGLLAPYRHHLRRVMRLTNAFSRPTLSDEGLPPGTERALVPPSAAPENQFDSIADFFAAIRLGSCRLDTDLSSGFYAHQLCALQPLLRPDAFPEAAMRQVDPDYVAALERFAGANLFMARETHVKQLDLAPVMAAVVPRVWIRPDIQVEPLPSYYARLADAFRFLRPVVEEGWGAEALAAPMRRESGPASATVAESIDETIGLCETAARVSRLELEGAANRPEVLDGRARLLTLWSDPDATGDARGMVPLGVTPGGTVRVLVFAGWEVQTLLIKLVSLPQQPAGTTLGGVGYPLPVPVVREARVAPSALLDRGEMRKRCDEALARNDVVA